MKPDGERRSFRLSEHRPDVDSEVRDEIGFHIEMRTRELRAAGHDEATARRLARESFGDAEHIRAESVRIRSTGARRRRWVTLFEGFVIDVRHGLRALARNPLYALVGVATLGLGIGVNVAIFSLVEATLLRAPAVAAPDGLVAVYTTCRRGDARCSSSYPDYEDYRDQSTRLSDLAVYSPMVVTVSTESQDLLLEGEYVSGNYFGLLGVNARLGRTIRPEDDRPGSDAAVAMLSAGFWRSAFGSDPDIVGQSIRVNGVEHIVIGVTDPGYDGLQLGAGPSVWIPLHGIGATDPERLASLESRQMRWLAGLVGRLQDGATVEAARAELLTISTRLFELDPEARGTRSVTVDPLARRILPTGNEQLVVSFLGVLQGVVALTLLLACANIANLQLARASSRRQEVSVRRALGVGRRRLVQQMLTESSVLALAGGAAGIAVAFVALRAVRGFQLPFGFDLGAIHATINGPVIAFAALLSVLTGLVFGAAPALLATRGDVASVLREGRGGEMRATGRARATLVAVQLALCVVLLVGAGLFLRTLYNRLQVDLGFPAEGLALVTVDPSLARMSAERAGFAAIQLAERAGALPGVTSAATATRAPIREGGNGTFAEVEGYVPEDGEDMRVEYVMVSDGFFRTLGLPIDAGEAGTADPGARLVVIDRTAADRWWRDREPIGSNITIGGGAYRVVGVARTAAWEGLATSPDPVLFVPVRPGDCGGQDAGSCAAGVFDGGFTLYVRTDGDAATLLPVLRDLVRSVDPDLAIRALRTVDQDVAAVLAPQRAAALLLGAFAILAIILAAVGITGVVSYTVVRRSRELSIRSALGAGPGQVVRLVTRDMVAPFAAGVGGGLIAASLLGRTLEGFLFGVDATDVVTYGAAVLVIGLTTTFATLLPARRAAAADPSRALVAD